MTAPHTPIVPTEKFRGMSRAGEYGDFVCEVDWCVGQVVDALDRKGIAEDTLLIFASDNGPEVFAYRIIMPDYRHFSNGHLRGIKYDAWEGGHRVPFIARWPGKIKPGSTSAQTICLTDLMATAAALTGAKLPNNAAEDSFNILPALLGKAKKPVREFTLHQTISLALAIRSGDWKYLDHKGSGGNNYNRDGRWGMKQYALPEQAPTAPGQLYNLKTDPGETTNLYFKHPKIVKTLKAKLEEFKKTGRSAPMRR
jgi:arylsulfatase A-like enzyme